MLEITISDYDPTWITGFERERGLLIAALISHEPFIEHIGSTAVPGLAAKPVIDIMIGVELESTLDKLITPIELLGYEYVKKYEAEMPYRRFFRKEVNGIRTHHIHAVSIAHEFWDRHLAFRDLLRSDKELASRYETLKRNLADRCRFERERYTDGKTDFILECLS